MIGNLLFANIGGGGEGGRGLHGVGNNSVKMYDEAETVLWPEKPQSR
jgi:hypothetical protein